MVSEQWAVIVNNLSNIPLDQALALVLQRRGEKKRRCQWYTRLRKWIACLKCWPFPSFMLVLSLFHSRITTSKIQSNLNLKDNLKKKWTRTAQLILWRTKYNRMRVIYELYMQHVNACIFRMVLGSKSFHMRSYYHGLWISKYQRVSKCNFLRDRRSKLADICLEIWPIYL